MVNMQTHSLTDEINQFNNDIVQLEQQSCENILTAIQHAYDIVEGNSKHSSAIEIINAWLTSMLKGMVNAQTLEELHAYQTSFKEALQHLSETSISKILIDACLKNIDALFTIRSTYLSKLSSHANIAKNFGWIALGAVCIIVGVLIPPIEIVVISLGIVGYVYGAIDFAKEAAESLSKKELPKLGQRDTHQFNTTIKNLIEPHRKTPSESISLFQTTKKKIIKTAGLMASAIGLTSGGAALLIALPSIAAIFPPALPFILAGIGLTAAVIAGGMYIRKLYQERQEVKQTINKQIEISNQFKHKLSKNKLTTSELDTTALIEKQLLGIKQNQQLNDKQKSLLTENATTSKISEVAKNTANSTLKTFDNTLKQIAQNEQQPLVNNGEEESGSEGEGGNNQKIEQSIENNTEAQETKPGMDTN